MIKPHDRMMPFPLERVTLLHAALAMVVLILAGCQRPPEPNTADIIAYARNGAVGAKVRHLGPAAQPYMEQVFNAYGAWHGAFSPVAELAEPKGLWPVASPLWRRAKTVDTQLETLQKWRETQLSRQQLHQDLATAIAAVPAAYQGDADQIRAQITKVFDATQPQQLDQIVRRYESLLSLVRDARATFDPDELGLAFRDGQTTAKAHELWDELHELIEQTHQDGLRQIDWALTTGKELREAAIKQKQSIDRNGADAQAALREIRSLDIDLHYYDKIIEAAERCKKQIAG